MKNISYLELFNLVKFAWQRIQNVSDLFQFDVRNKIYPESNDLTKLSWSLRNHPAPLVLNGGYMLWSVAIKEKLKFWK